MYEMKRGNPPPGSLHYFFQRVAGDLLCAMSHRQGTTFPAFNDPVEGTRCSETLFFKLDPEPGG